MVELPFSVLYLLYLLSLCPLIVLLSFSLRDKLLRYGPHGVGATVTDCALILSVITFFGRLGMTRCALRMCRWMRAASRRYWSGSCG